MPVGNNRVGAGNYNNPVPVGRNNFNPGAGNFNGHVPVGGNNFNNPVPVGNNINNPGFPPGFVAGPGAAGNVPAGGFKHGHGIIARDVAGDDIEEDEGGDPIATRDSAGNDQKDPYLKSLHGHPLDTRDAARCLVARDDGIRRTGVLHTDCFGTGRGWYLGTGVGRYMARDEYGGGKGDKGDKGDKFPWPKFTLSQDTKDRSRDAWDSVLGHVKMARDEDAEGSARRPARAGRGIIAVGRDRHPENWRTDDNNNNSKHRRDVVDARDEDDVDPEALEIAVRQILSEYLADAEDTHRPARAVRGVVARDEDPGKRNDTAVEVGKTVERLARILMGIPHDHRLARAARGVVARDEIDGVTRKKFADAVGKTAERFTQIATGLPHRARAVGDVVVARDEIDGVTRKKIADAVGKTAERFTQIATGLPHRARAVGGVVVARSGGNSSNHTTAAVTGGSNNNNNNNNLNITHTRHAQKEIGLGPLHDTAPHLLHLLAARGKNATATQKKKGTNTTNTGNKKALHRAARRDVVPSAPPVKDAVAASTSNTVTPVAATPTSTGTSTSGGKTAKKNAAEGSGLGGIARALGVGGAALAVAIAIL